MFVREYGFTITEHDPARPWMVLSSEHRTITLPDGRDFFPWAREQWPAPRWSVELDPWQLGPGLAVSGGHSAARRHEANAVTDHFHRRLHALLLGGVDMHDVLETARYLCDEHLDAPKHGAGMPWRVRRTLETGMLVSYARPFVDSRGGLPSLKLAPNLTPELRQSHRDILKRRNSVYAHTDETPLRRIIELSELSAPATLDEWTREEGVLQEEWYPPTAAGLADLIALATAHLESFIREIDALRRSITGTPQTTPGPEGQGDASVRMPEGT